jgi:hypothetical protein
MAQRSMALPAAAILLALITIITAQSTHRTALDSAIIYTGASNRAAPASFPVPRGAKRSFTPPDLSANPRYQNQPYNICISDWTPMVYCKDIEDPAAYTGFAVDVMRNIATDFGWVEGVNYTWTCMDTSPMIDDLLNPNGSCYVAAGGELWEGWLRVEVASG